MVRQVWRALRLNPTQKQAIVTKDQSVYALVKQIQRNYQDKFHNALWMMGLHIDMSFLCAIGNWFDGSGRTDQT